MERIVTSNSADESPEVFISYSHLDQEVAQRFALALQHEDFHVWWDPALRSGDRWDDVVERALRGARAVVVLWSKQSVASHWVRSEAALAHRNGTIAPAMIEPCERPVMFELVETADLSHWRGERADAAWLAYLADIRRLVERDGPTAPAGGAAVVTDRPRTIARPHFQATAPLPNNLPRQLSPIIGRSEDLSDIETLLAENPMVMLVGPGGIGKTRLCLEIGQRLVSNEANAPLTDYVRRKFPAGVWMINLAALTDPQLIGATAAAAMEIALPDEGEAEQALTRRLSRENLLILLDNCEHMLEGAARFCEQLLEHCPGVRILATSHEPLRISGEAVYHIQALALPASDEVTAEQALSSPAVALFAARARAADSRFTFQDGAVRTVVTICRRLDGLPLAIEMAAARVSTLGLETVASNLDERFKILTAGRRTALPRQQTLRATLEWSYSLLTLEQQAIFRQLGVFPASFSIEAAQTVAFTESADSWARAETVEYLAARSLLSWDPARQQQRYRMLETSREFARLKLHEGGEWPVIAQRHGAFTRERLDRAYQESFRASDSELRHSYEPDLENLRAAIDWAFASGGDVETGFALLGASEPLYLALAQISECRARIETFITRIDEVESAAVRARVWDSYGRALGFSNPSKAYECLSRAVPVYRDTDPIRLGALLVYMGRIAQVIADRSEESERLLDEGAPLVEAAKIARLKGHLFRGMSNRYASHGNFAQSVAMMQRAAAAFLEGGAPSAASTARTSLGYMLWASGDIQAAAKVCRQVITYIRGFQFPNESALGFALGNLTGILTALGDLAAAGAALAEATPMLAEPWQIWVIFDHVALLAARCGEDALAARALGYCDAAYAEHRTARQANELRAHNEAQASVEQALGTTPAKAAQELGSRLTRAGALALALEVAERASARAAAH